MLINCSRAVLRPAMIRLCCRCYVVLHTDPILLFYLKQGIDNKDTPVQQSRDGRLMRFIDWSLGLRRSVSVYVMIVFCILVTIATANSSYKDL